MAIETTNSGGNTAGTPDGTDDTTDPQRWPESSATTEESGEHEGDSSGNVTPEGTDAQGPDTGDTGTEGAVPAGAAAGSAGTASAGGFLTGSVAVVSAGLGVSSLVGTSLGDMLRTRQEIIGQIESSTGGGGDQVEAFFGAPWNIAALTNGVFALVAFLLGGVLLAAHARRADTPSWVKAVATGGVVLGTLGLLISGGMYFDLFAGQPEMPQMPQMPGGG